MELQITAQHMEDFRGYLWREEKTEGTIEKYGRDVGAFVRWLQGREVTKEETAKWKQHLIEKGYAPVTINSMLSALNVFLRFMGWKELRVKFLRIQRRMFREQTRELRQEEYVRLLKKAYGLGKMRLGLLMETICSTGIRVSEVVYITVEAVHRRKAEIALKGKIRTILLPGKLCRKLLKYAQKEKIKSGEIFLTRKGKSFSRYQIWREMKELCKQAGVEESKVFPHNLRHLFAVTFYRFTKDIVKLADVLGHSSLQTTRIYLVSTDKEHIRQLNQLGLVI